MVLKCHPINICKIIVKFHLDNNLYECNLKLNMLAHYMHCLISHVLLFLMCQTKNTCIQNIWWSAYKNECLVNRMEVSSGVFFFSLFHFRFCFFFYFIIFRRQFSFVTFRFNWMSENLVYIQCMSNAANQCDWIVCKMRQSVLNNISEHSAHHHHTQHHHSLIDFSRQFNVHLSDVEN